MLTYSLSQFTVYDVSRYLDEHPGGRDLLLEVIGTDATEHFVQAGHSDEAEETLAGLAVGYIPNYQDTNVEETKSALFQTEKGPAAASVRASSQLAMAVPGAAFVALFLRLVVRHSGIGTAWIHLPSGGGLSLFTINTPSALFLSSIIGLMGILGAFAYWASTIIYVEFGYGKYPEVIPARTKG